MPAQRPLAPESGPAPLGKPTPPSEMPLGRCLSVPAAPGTDRHSWGGGRVGSVPGPWGGGPFPFRPRGAREMGALSDGAQIRRRASAAGVPRWSWERDPRPLAIHPGEPRKAVDFHHARRLSYGSTEGSINASGATPLEARTPQGERAGRRAASPGKRTALKWGLAGIGR